MYYFAYGSNMRQSRLEERVRRSPLIWKTGFLKDYRLSFNKIRGDGSAYSNIMHSNGNSVWGVLYELTEGEIGLLDEFEGVTKHYIRGPKLIRIKEGDCSAEVYIANENMIADNLLPRRKYLDLLITGAIEHNLPNDYIGYLKNFKTYD